MKLLSILVLVNLFSSLVLNDVSWYSLIIWAMSPTQDTAELAILAGGLMEF